MPKVVRSSATVSVRSETEGVPRRAGEDGEHFVTVRVVGWLARGLELVRAEGDCALTSLLNVIHVQVKVHLLLLGTGRPLRGYMVRRVLDAYHPFAVNHDAVPVVVAMYRATKQASPESTLGVDVLGVEHHHAPDDLHAHSRLGFFDGTIVAVVTTAEAGLNCRTVCGTRPCGHHARNARQCREQRGHPIPPRSARPRQ